MHITNHSSRSQKTPFFVPSELNRYMPMKIVSILLVLIMLTTCIHTPSHYASLKNEVYSSGEARFSDSALNSKTKYASLSLREDGACSITEIRGGISYRGAGSWRKTKYSNIIKIGLSSSSTVTMYHFYVRLYEENRTYLVSDKLKKLVD